MKYKLVLILMQIDMFSWF